MCIFLLLFKHQNMNTIITLFYCIPPASTVIWRASRPGLSAGSCALRQTLPLALIAPTLFGRANRSERTIDSSSVDRPLSLLFSLNIKSYSIFAMSRLLAGPSLLQSVHTNKHICSGAEVSTCLFSNKVFHAVN